MTRKSRSIFSVVAGLLAIFVVTTVVDVVLHATHVYPPWTQPISNNLAALAFAYRVVISIAGCYLTAQLAPDRPMQHALVLGGIGVILSAIGAAATWGKGLGPEWYPLALIVISIPCAWLGAKIRMLQS